MNDKKAIKAVKKLKKYCKKHKNDCDKCIFNYPIYDNDESFCNINFTFSPGTWGIKKLKKIKKEIKKTR